MNQILSVFSKKCYEKKNKHFIAGPHSVDMCHLRILPPASGGIIRSEWGTGPVDSGDFSAGYLGEIGENAGI